MMIRGIAAIGLLASLGSGAAGQVLNQSFKILPDDVAHLHRFGTSIAIASGIVAVGADGDDDNGSFSGSAYLFDSATGAQIAKLLPDDGAPSDFFGNSIAIASGIVAVGALGDDDNGSASGSAYLFDSATGAQIAKLLPDDGEPNDQFGLSIAIADGVVAVGAWLDDDNGSDSGSAYLFNAATGIQIAKLLPDDGAESDNFGYSIAIADGVVAVGARRDDDNGSDSGSAYLFDATTGVQIDKLLPDDGAADDFFGQSIAIAGGVVAVGAVLRDGNADDSGSVYLFDTATGDLITTLIAGDGVQNSRFGNSVAIADGVVAVGAYQDDDNGHHSGSAYLFDTATGALIAKLLPDDGAPGDFFGSSIAIDNGVIAVGATQDVDNGLRSGSAYMFDLNPCSPADLAFPPGALDFSDVTAFLGAFDALDPAADLAPPMGAFDFSDVVAFLTAFGAGCP